MQVKESYQDSNGNWTDEAMDILSGRVVPQGIKVEKSPFESYFQKMFAEIDELNMGNFND